MEKTFCIQGDIAVMRNSMPVRFVHRLTQDSPENHVLHLNNYLEIYVFISGNHKYIVENSLYELRRGDIIIINPREVHKALTMSNCMYERFYFLVDCHAFDGLCLNPLSSGLSSITGGGNLISPDDKNREAILEMLYAISDCFRDGREDSFRAMSFFMRILDEINRQLNAGCVAPGTGTHIPQRLEQVLTYVSDNTAVIQSVSEIASAMGLTPQYLSAYFSRHIGTPLKSYIQAKKIALAKNLLDNGADVTQACFDCGFNDCSYFIRIFKKYVGTTPLNYKRGHSV